MTQHNDENPIKNAEAVIELFGGIRPMASKMDVPVTTVQGWKKRGVIPANRRDDIIRAADLHRVQLGDVLMQETHGPAETVTRPIEKQDEFAVKKTAPRMPEQGPTPTHEELMAEIAKSSEKTLQTSIWMATGLILLAAVVGAFLLWPSAQKIEEHDARLAALSGDVDALDGEVSDVNRRASFLKGMIPEEMKQRLDEIQTQARNLQTNVQQLSERANEIQETVLSADAGSLSERLDHLEEQIQAMTGSESGIGGLSERIRTLEQSFSGQEQLSAAMEELQGIVGGLEGKVTNLDEQLAEAQDGEGALGQTLEGVSGDDLKAAAMLMTFSQLRDSFNREAPFEDDLQLLYNMVDEDDVEMRAALDRLAPHANGGVLTPSGLSNEFKSMAGDIVVSSLKGEDVSIMDQAKARFANIMRVEKDGVPLTGTPEQEVVTQAQKMLDEGKVKEAVTLLQTLDGPAAQTAAPFIEEAQGTLAAQGVQDMVYQMILSNIGSASGSVNPAAGLQGMMPQNMDMNGIKDQVEGALTGQPEVIRDEETGIIILPRQQTLDQKFRGLAQ